MTHVDIRPVDEEEISLLHLFEARKPIYPAKVSGLFRRLKWGMMIGLLGLYYLLPWVRWHRGEGAPDQAILLDVINRKFYFFFIEVWPQEVYYFTGLLLIAALGLFFATTLFGRVWCGYACPQTVWTDLFLHVERFFEGDRNAQIKLAEAPWSLSKLGRKLAKHVTWILIGLATGGAWVFYFNDTPTLWHDMLHGQFKFVPTFWMVFLTGSTYLMAGFAREQVCTYMCPYARFQGAMFDEDSLLVTYDKERGEPRGKGDSHGDCVDCGRCVAVCPTGIDIRDGQQYRCINCGLCVDACNTVMAKLGRMGNLIRYNTLNNAIPASAGWWDAWRFARFVRPRTVIYLTIMCVVGSTMLYALMTRALVDINVLHQRSPLFVVMGDGHIRNTYTIRLINKTWQHVDDVLTTTNPAIRLSALDIATDAEGRLHLPVKPGKVAEYTVFADLAPGTDVKPHMPLEFVVRSDVAGEAGYTSFFASPDL